MTNRASMALQAIETSERAAGPAETISRLMAGCVRLLPILLTNMIGGGALVTAARFKWDPLTYVVVRLVFPAEYRVMAVMLTVGGSALVLLPLFAVATLGCSRPGVRRLLLFVYGAAMCALILAEATWCGWMVNRLMAWLASQKAQFIQEALGLREHIKALLNFLSRIHTLPKIIADQIEEAEADLPRNLYAVVAGAALLVLLQVSAVALALALALCGSRARRASRLSHSWATTNTALTGDMSEKAPLRTAYKNGRIVIL
ncbi:hypothetical protein O3G_MSEX011854 [Manduca sexta]|uniref:Uncharacterized protein n=1 Tax=Manduca sexta TaxID=7130 RepID=A0A921ZLM0_MANSE|nr:hypothetical protein O3G_MSEX011854 [Manduca sexta]